MTSQSKTVWTYRLGAIFYALWGLLHLLAAWRGYELASVQEAGLVQARLYQGAWNMAFLGLLVLGIAIVFNWRNSLIGYWLNLITVSVVDIGFIVLLLIPGYSTDIIGPILWILGAIATTIGIRVAPKTP